MRPTVREWLRTLIPGLITFGLLLLMGAPLWAAFGFGGVITELRQVPLLIREEYARRSATTEAVRDAVLQATRMIHN